MVPAQLALLARLLQDLGLGVVAVGGVAQRARDDGRRCGERRGGGGGGGGRSRGTSDGLPLGNAALLVDEAALVPDGAGAGLPLGEAVLSGWM